MIPLVTASNASPRFDGAPSDDAARAPGKASSGRGWIMMVFGLLAGQMLMCVAMVLIATRDPSFAIEPNYYDKAVRWNETARQRSLNATLGWQTAVTIGEAAGGDGIRRVSVTLRTREGAAIDAAQLSAEAFHHADSGKRMTLNLAGVGDGLYVTEAEMPRMGVWELRFLAVRGDDTFTFVEKTFVP